MSFNYLKIGKATELAGRERKIYRGLEMFPGGFSVLTLLALIVFSYFKPVWVAYFIIAFDVYWLLQVIFLGIYLLSGYRKMNQIKKVDWKKKCDQLEISGNFLEYQKELPLYQQGLRVDELYQLIILPTYSESVEIIRTALDSLIKDGYPVKKMIVVLGMEQRFGEAIYQKAETISREYQGIFRNLLVTYHPDIEGELKGKGANQAYMAKEARAKIIDAENLPYDKILVSVFDIDTIVEPGYFFRLTYLFLTVPNAYHASYQPVPIYHNNVWQAPFFARVASSSNTFWQMMQQIRPEKLSTYSSHSMTFKALADIGFWSTTMVSEDSRIFFHCLFYYQGDYRVEPMYFPVYMDTTMDKNTWQTIKSLYKQQRRWAWGSENLPYLMFNTGKSWKNIVDKKNILRHIFVQIYGFHSWATNALIIAIVGWLPIILGGSRFHNTVLSGNLTEVTTWLMNLAMIGLFSSAIVSSKLLPKRPQKYSAWKNVLMFLEWIFIPVSVIAFGAIPCLDAQIRLMLGKYMGFWVTPKERN